MALSPKQKEIIEAGALILGGIALVWWFAHHTAPAPQDETTGLAGPAASTPSFLTLNYPSAANPTNVPGVGPVALGPPGAVTNPFSYIAGNDSLSNPFANSTGGTTIGGANNTVGGITNSPSFGGFTGGGQPSEGCGCCAVPGGSGDAMPDANSLLDLLTTLSNPMSSVAAQFHPITPVQVDLARIREQDLEIATGF